MGAHNNIVMRIHTVYTYLKPYYHVLRLSSYTRPLHYNTRLCSSKFSTHSKDLYRSGEVACMRRGGEQDSMAWLQWSLWVLKKVPQTIVKIARGALAPKARMSLQAGVSS